MGQDLRVYILVLQAVEGFVKGLIIPFVSCDLIVGHPSIGI